jgi:RNA polymerase sigma-70 factor (ECF subfamily)
LVEVEAEPDVDAGLMQKVAAGDRRAFAALFDRHQASVVRFAYRFVGDRARAEELAQDIFVKLYRNAKSYRPSAKFKTFLFRVATNHCLNEVRRGEYRVKHVQDDAGKSEAEALPGPSGSSPDQELAGRELEALVQRALGELSDRERAAFSMCRFEGMAYREIASALKATEAAVKSLIHRATLSVAKRIQEASAGGEPARSRA